MPQDFSSRFELNCCKIPVLLKSLPELIVPLQKRASEIHDSALDRITFEPALRLWAGHGVISVNA